MSNMKYTFVTVCALLLCVSAAVAQTTKIVAHRGAWKNTRVPENSLASLQAAIDQEVWGAEFDVHLTKDEVLVVNHNYDFYGLMIENSTYEQLLAKKHPNGENIPTLEEYLRYGKGKDIKLVLELKASQVDEERTIKASEKAFNLVQQLGMRDQVVYISFSYASCLKFRELDPEAHVQYLSFDKSLEQLKMDKLSGYDYYYQLLMQLMFQVPDFIKKSKEMGLSTNVWTVNEANAMQYFIGHGIDYITTDEPELLKSLLAK